MTVALIFPPVVDPRAPHLALPSLAAFLRSHGIDVRMYDLNVRSMRYLLQSHRLRQAAEKVRGAMHGRWDLSTPESKLALYGRKVASSMDSALETLTDPHRFFDAHAFNSARELVVSGLALSAAARNPRISYDFTPPRYDVEGIDPQKLVDLIEVTGRDDLNLFLEHWRDHLFPELEQIRPELVGVTITNRQQVIPGLMLARLLREQGHFTVIGGTVYTKFAHELETRPEFFRHFADAVIVYEGETALLTLIDELRGARQLSRVPNLLYAERDRVHATRTHLENINALPTPDFEGLDLTSYLAPYPVLPILTGKGCYFNRCKFCDIPFINHISRKAYRVREVERIVGDVETLADRFGCRHFVITDEALSPRLLLKLANALDGDRHRSLCFTGYARLEAGFTPDVCEKLSDMGMKKIFFGLESADQSTLDHMDKGTRADLAPQVLRNCADADVHFHIFSIIGFPQESEASARSTFDFFIENHELIDHPGNSFDIHPFGLELRTDYFRDRDRYGITIDPEALNKDFVVGIDAGQWSNPDSLDSGRVKHLLRDEFYPGLREAYSRFHATVDPVWPGFEEYAVLYSDHYKDRPFPFYTSVPAPGEAEQVELSWNTSLSVHEKDDVVLLLQRHNYLLVSRKTYACLAGRRFSDINDLPSLEGCVEGHGSEAKLRFLNELVSHAYLRVRIISKTVPEAGQPTEEIVQSSA